MNHPPSLQSDQPSPAPLPDAPSTRSAKRPLGRRLAPAGVALAVLGVAGTMIVRQAREFGLWDEATQAGVAMFTPKPVPGPPPPQTYEPNHESGIAIGTVGDRTVVSLSKSDHRRDRGEILIGILGVEVFRQALLIAARDGLGAGVRDGMLGEALVPAKEGDAAAKFQLHSWLLENGIARFSLRRGETILWTGDFKCPTHDALVPDYPALLAKLEGFSRKELVKALADQGVKPAPSRAVAGPGGPDPVEDPDLPLSFVGQFAKVRALHRAILERGETLGRLADLARAYANLGVLTQHHWNPSHKAFEARALLYAERLKALHPKAPESYWARAYVRGVIGFHRDALADLDVAARLAGKGQEPPAWVDLVGRLCRYDTPGLVAACSDPSRAQLAAIFAVLTVESSPARAQAMDTVAAARRAFPDSLFITDASCLLPGVSHLHVATLEGLNQLGNVVPRELGTLKDLPEGAKAIVTATNGEVELAKALVEAGEPARDPVEPSWSVLGGMIREARFAQVARRAQFMAIQWAVPVDDFLEGVRPLVSDHPFWPVLESYLPTDQADAAAQRERLEKIDLSDVEPTELLLYQALLRYRSPKALSSFQAAMKHGDWLARDEVVHLPTVQENERVRVARLLTGTSPYLPAGDAYIVEKGFATLKPGELEAMRERHAQHPEFLAAFARHLQEEKRYSEAEATFRAALALSPDRMTSRALASIYRETNQIDLWRETLERFLQEKDDAGLEHAQVQVELANDYMARKEWEKARPYADAAAETWAGWAMLCASRCHEGMKEWDEAELWARRVSERYGNSRSAWFEFCSRTGHGDITTAGDLMAQVVLADPDRASPTDLERLGMYFVLLKEDRRARDTYETMIKRVGNGDADRSRQAFGWLRVATLADRLDEAEARNKALDEAIALLDGKAPRSTKIARILRDCVHAPAGTPLDLAAIDQVLDNSGTDDQAMQARGNIAYFVGRFAEKHGRKDEAAKYYGYTTVDIYPPCPDRPLAIAALRALGVKVGPEGDL